MPTAYTLTGDIGDLLGNTSVVPTAEARLETNLRAEDALVHAATGGTVRLGGLEVPLNADGTFTVAGLVGSDSTDLNVAAGVLQYRLVVKYRNPATGREQTWRDDWFHLNGDSDIATVVKAISPEVAETGADIIAQAEAARDQASEIAGLTGEDSAVAFLVDNPSDTQTALDGRYASAAEIDAEIDSRREVPSGLAGLGADGKVYQARIPDLSLDYATQAQVADRVTVEEAPYNPRDAAGDGTTDDTAVLQAALDRGGPVRLIPGRTYKTSSTLYPRAGTRLIGDDVTIRHIGAGRGLEIRESGSTVEGLTVDMGRDANARGGGQYEQQGIYVASVASIINGVTLRRVTVHNCWYRGIDIAESTASGSLKAINDIVLDEVRALDCGDTTGGDTVGARGISIAQNSGIRCTLINPVTRRTSKGGIIVPSASGLAIIAPIVEDAADQGISLGQVIGQAVNGATIVAPTVRRCTKYGIAVSMSAYRWNIVGGSIEACTDGGITIDVEKSDPLGVIQDAYGTVTGTAIKGSGTASGRGVLVRYARGVTLTGLNLSNYQYGIEAATSLNTVVSSSVFDTLNTGIYQVEASGVMSGRLQPVGNTFRNVTTISSGTVTYPVVQGFYGQNPVARPTVPAAGVATVSDLRNALATLGLIQ